MGDWKIAISDLETLQRSHTVPKLGTLQRWVRECDGVFSAGGGDGGGSKIEGEGVDASDGRVGQRLENGPLACLDAVLRTTDPSAIGAIGRGSLDGSGKRLASKRLLNGNIRQYPPWHPFPRPHLSPDLQSPADEEVVKGAQKCTIIPANERLPPNKYPLSIWSTVNCPFPLDPSPPSPTLVGCPFVADGWVVKDLLTPRECKRIIALGRRVFVSKG